MISEYLKMLVDWPFGTLCAFLTWCLMILLVRVILLVEAVLEKERFDLELENLTK
jgi:hypothetical protein